MQSRIHKVYACLAVTCHLHFWRNDRDLLSATAVTRGGTDTEIRVSTESRPCRRKFSRRSSRDSNPRPFNHESGALTTELFPPQGILLYKMPLSLRKQCCFLLLLLVVVFLHVRIFSSSIPPSDQRCRTFSDVLLCTISFNNRHFVLCTTSLKHKTAMEYKLIPARIMRCTGDTVMKVCERKIHTVL